MGSMNETYDFVIVGSGPAGSTIASRLARSSKQPSVLLIEAGGDNANESLRVNGEKWTTLTNPELNWGYKTVPQKECNDREIDYSRGKGLGGSSTINFGMYTVGAKDDYEEWSRIVEDDSFKWDNVQRRLKDLESFHDDELDEEYQKYVKPSKANHGSKGALNIGFANSWEKDIPTMLDQYEDADYPMNTDLNSGNPIGIGVCATSAYHGLRTTAADLLTGAPSNLTILTNTKIDRVLLEGTKAIGVESDGRQFHATKEVILSAGSLDGPKILMLSGIGPAAELQKHNIPLICDLPIGQGLRDHPGVFTLFARIEDLNARASFYGSPDAVAAAKQQWNLDRTGPLSHLACTNGMGFVKSASVIQSAEFKALPDSEQEFLQKATIPTYEILTHFPGHMLDPIIPPSLSYSCMTTILMNGQSRGTVTLSSSSPSSPPVMDPQLLSHPYDRRVAIEALREMNEFTALPAFAKDTVGDILVPKSNSDEDLLEFARQNMISCWHMTGTVKMGRPSDPETCVDNDFKVLGVENLRVADMSVVPVLTNNHVQATAYATGATLAEKLVAEYGLE